MNPRCAACTFSASAPTRVRRATAHLLALVLALVAMTASAPRAAAVPPVPVTFAMRILVLDDGSATVGAWIDYFDQEGIAHTDLDLTSDSREVITADYLADWGDPIRAHYYGVVAPNAAPGQLSVDELDSLAAFERTLGVRQLNVYTWANPSIGLDYPRYAGQVDGLRAAVTEYGTANGLAYLTGVTLDDFSADIPESYGYLATPLAPTESTELAPVLTAPIPGESASGVLAGVLTQDGREQMMLTFASNQHQNHFRMLAPGLLSWLTRGVTTSYHRAWFSVNIDDVLLDDDLWDTDANCTRGSAGCPAAPDDVPSRMTPDDVARLDAWQDETGIMFDLTFNGYGTVAYADEHGADRLASALIDQQESFRWINHTWSHAYLGCEQDDSTTPWRCATDATGATLYPDEAVILDEIRQNHAWATQAGLTRYRYDSLVTGEHSGLRTLPQMPEDNPHLAAALSAAGIRWVASDASRESAQRKLAAGLRTVPRYPMNIFYNVETQEQEVDEYNWIYTSAADGGSGLCEQYAEAMTCIEPLDPATGFADHIVPVETRIALAHVLGNDPRPHYAHQSNLAADGILYDVAYSIVDSYRADVADNAPLLNPTLAEAGAVLRLQDQWRDGGDAIVGSIFGTTVRLTNTATTRLRVPLTVPEGSRRGRTRYGEAYGGQRSGWTPLRPGGRLTVRLPQGAGFPATVRPGAAASPGDPVAAQAPALPTVAPAVAVDPAATDAARRGTLVPLPGVASPAIPARRS
ncbi:MAG: hypothetical protein ACK5LS_04825 [Propioniciclava sp.]